MQRMLYLEGFQKEFRRFKSSINSEDGSLSTISVQKGISILEILAIFCPELLMLFYYTCDKILRFSSKSFTTSCKFRKTLRDAKFLKFDVDVLKIRLETSWTRV